MAAKSIFEMVFKSLPERNLYWRFNERLSEQIFPLFSRYPHIHRPQTRPSHGGFNVFICTFFNDVYLFVSFATQIDIQIKFP